MMGVRMGGIILLRENPLFRKLMLRVRDELVIANFNLELLRDRAELKKKRKS